MSIYSLSLLMFLSGAIGGLASCIVSPPENKDETIKQSYLKITVLGVIVAFTLPLFLSLAQSRLVDEIVNPNPVQKSVGASALVLMGFCIIAAFSARRFLEGLSERILADLRAVKRDIREQERQIEKIDEALEENITPPEQSAESTSAFSQSSTPTISEDSSDMLKVLYATSKNTKRTLTGISTDSDLDRESARKIVDKAISKGFIEMTTSDRTGGRRFRLTRAGTTELTKQSAQPGN